MTRYLTIAALIGAAYYFAQKPGAQEPPAKPVATEHAAATAPREPIHALTLSEPGKPVFIKGTTFQRIKEGWLVEGQDASQALQNAPTSSARAAGGGGHFLAFQTSAVSGPLLLLDHPQGNTLADQDKIKCYAAPCGTFQSEDVLGNLSTLHVYRFVKF